MTTDDSLIWNLSDVNEKRRLMLQISKLSGLHEVRIKPRKRTRTLDQNNYYFVAIVQVFRDWLREQYGDPMITSDQAHEMLKVKILGLDERLIEGTNEVLNFIPRSKTLSTEEFGVYIDKCSNWLAAFCEILVVPAELFYDKGVRLSPEKKGDSKAI